ncbi:MAG TPA: rhodanese-like domain-containing protein [Ignavibacteria bacterium]
MKNHQISPQEIKNKLRSKKNDFLIVDIRDVHEYSDWNIKGSMNVPINSYMAKGEYGNIKQELTKLPKDKFIITVCARGINSQVAASMLRDMGYDSSSLEKGMKGWNENFDIYEIDFPNFVVAQFVRIGKGCLSYIIYSKDGKMAVAIEPSIFINEYMEYSDSKDIKIKYVIDTHAHADHFSGAMALSRETGTDYHINAIDVDGSFQFKPLNELRELKIDNVVVKIVPTPGHTDGSVSLLIDNLALICGDLLLLESPGRPDLARTKEDTIVGAGILFNTLKEKILTLNDTTSVFPSHFTTSELRPVVLKLGELKKVNKGLAIRDKEEFINYLTSNIPLTPPNYEAIKRFNKGGVIIPMDYAEDLEIGPNRCAAR